MTKETQKLITDVRMAGFENAADYIENLTEEDKSNINFCQTTDKLWDAFDWAGTPQGNFFWREIAYKIDSIKYGRITKPNCRF